MFSHGKYNSAHLPGEWCPPPEKSFFYKRPLFFPWRFRICLLAQLVQPLFHPFQRPEQIHRGRRAVAIYSFAQWKSLAKSWKLGDSKSLTAR